MRRWAERVVPVLLALGLGGCAIPSAAAGDLDIGDFAHRWVYYPSERVYACDAHAHYWVLQDGAWVERRRVSADLGAARAVVLSGPVRREAEHSWIFYPSEELYRCQRHDHGWTYGPGGWVARQGVAEPLSGGVAVEVTGPAPYVRHERHSRASPIGHLPHTLQAARPSTERAPAALPAVVWQACPPALPGRLVVD